MTDNDLRWIEDLLDEYPTKRSDQAIARLIRIFKDETTATMTKAVDRYMRNESFFPKVSTLRPYVDLIIEESRGTINYYERGYVATDDELLRFEQARGTMPADNQLGKEYA